MMVLANRTMAAPDGMLGWNVLPTSLFAGSFACHSSNVRLPQPLPVIVMPGGAAHNELFRACKMHYPKPAQHQHQHQHQH